MTEAKHNQNERPKTFEELARDLGCDEDEKAFEQVVKRVATGSRTDFAAMTVNERMGYIPGLTGKWVAAARARDRAAMIEIMKQVDYNGDTSQTVDIVLADPAKYGF